jgi:hypothetical protein
VNCGLDQRYAGAPLWLYVLLMYQSDLCAATDVSSNPCVPDGTDVMMGLFCGAHEIRAEHDRVIHMLQSLSSLDT